VTPQQVNVSGTIRYTESEAQDQIHAEIEQALQTAQAMGGDSALEINIGYPQMFHAPGAVELLNQVAPDLLGTRHTRSDRQEMGAEDSGYFSALTSEATFKLGYQIDGDERTHHHPRFDIDEGCLPIGTAALAEAALRRLRC
jgi:amidohydrolase